MVSDATTLRSAADHGSAPRVLALIPARGGSKGLPGKNLRPLAGHPLVAWSVAAGLQAATVTRVVCSTDDPQIAAVARAYGAEVPFLRPAELAADDTLDLPVCQHALDWLEREQGWRADVIVQLRPTAPLRFPGQVDKAVRLLLAAPGATGVRTVIPAPANPYKMWLLPDSGAQPWLRPLLGVQDIEEPFNLPRQKLPQAYWQTGTIDVVWASVVMSGRMSGERLLPMRVDPRQAVDIDSEADMMACSVRAESLDCLRPVAPPISIRA
jgi:N-acylneuraminate cytidylyltransferase